MTDEPKKHGFSSMTPERRKEIARMGQQALTAKGTRRQWTKEQASAASKKSHAVRAARKQAEGAVSST